MVVKRFAAEDDRIVHDRLLACLKGRRQVLELLVDIREPFGDIGGLNLIRIDAVVHEHIEIGIVLPEQLAYADEGKVIILFCYKALRLIIHHPLRRLKQTRAEIEHRQQTQHLFAPFFALMLRAFLNEQASLRRSGHKSDSAVFINERFHVFVQKIAQRYKKILIYAKKSVILQSQTKINKQSSMKKCILAAFVALSMSAFAQHVTPLSIELTEFKLDSLRTLYLAEPPMYRAALNMVAQSLDMDAAAVNEAKTQLKVERAHSKQIATSIKEATKMTNELRKLYGKEESELKSMQKSVVRQQETINRQMELNVETRENYMQFLAKQQSELGYALREAADRMRAITDLETSIQKGQTALQTFNHEIEAKAKDLTLIETELKKRQAAVKAELKTAKTMK